jgi:uncharacterized membrane protein
LFQRVQRAAREAADEMEHSEIPTPSASIDELAEQAEHKRAELSTSVLMYSTNDSPTQDKRTSMDTYKATFHLAGKRVNISDYERLFSLIGGGALALYGLRRAPAGLLLALLGGALIRRGVSGHCSVYQALEMSTVEGDEHIKTVTRSLTINRRADDIYDLWRNFKNIPRFMPHITQVEKRDEQSSHWTASLPLGKQISWDVEITNDQRDRSISWRSRPDAPLHYSGTISFEAAPGHRGTEVTLSLQYQPPGGVVGAAAAKLFGVALEQQVAEALRRCKQILETGQLTTSDVAPPAEPAPGTDRRQNARNPRDEVSVAADDSFPASDPPAWTLGRETEA